jgi:hypothetical protein
VENMGGFFLSHLHFLHHGNHVIDFFGENFWWRRQVMACEVGVRGRLVGQALVVSEGGTDCWW